MHTVLIPFMGLSLIPSLADIPNALLEKVLPCVAELRKIVSRLSMLKQIFPQSFMSASFLMSRFGFVQPHD